MRKLLPLGAVLGVDILIHRFRFLNRKHVRSYVFCKLTRVGFSMELDKKWTPGHLRVFHLRQT